MTSIPRGIATDQVRQLLISIDRSTAMGRRDYAILLLLTRLGLRSGEVTSLHPTRVGGDIGTDILPNFGGNLVHSFPT